jgi:hypothetical protein
MQKFGTTKIMHLVGSYYADISRCTVNKTLNSQTLFTDITVISTPTVHITVMLILLTTGKGKVHPCTGNEALYRPYGP